MINTIVTEDYAGLSRAAARLIAATLIFEKDPSTVVATGNTPMGAYAELVQMKLQGEFTPRGKFYQLDEYLGLTDDDPRTLWGWMERSFVTPLGIEPGGVRRLRCDAADPSAACLEYDREIESNGGLKLAVLGLGPNGHLAFNEPPAREDAPTRVITLTEESIESNSFYWGGRDRVPPQAMTMGMKQILGARTIILLVSGKSKKSILRRVLKGPVCANVPASFLQKHPRVWVIADKDAVS